MDNKRKYCTSSRNTKSFLYSQPIYLNETNISGIVERIETYKFVVGGHCNARTTRCCSRRKQQRQVVAKCSQTNGIRYNVLPLSRLINLLIRIIYNLIDLFIIKNVICVEDEMLIRQLRLNL